MKSLFHSDCNDKYFMSYDSLEPHIQICKYMLDPVFWTMQEH